MNYSVKTLSVFERQAKRLVKKYPSFKIQLQELVRELKVNPEKGTPIGHDCYKLRIAIAGKGKGKSGGARVIIHLVYRSETVYLLSVYDKSEIENLTDKDILDLLKLFRQYPGV